MNVPTPEDALLKQNHLGFRELKIRPSEEDLSLYYRTKYFQEARGSYERLYSSDELTYFHNRLQRIHCLVDKYHKNKADKTLLDVGCGEGFALSFFSKHGFSVFGIDYSSAGVEQQNPDFVNFLATGDLFKLLHDRNDSGDKYDVVLLQNVLEHVLDPFKLCFLLKGLLAEGGIAVITVPNDFSPLQLEAMALGYIESEFWVCPPDHISYFTSDTLANLLTTSGFIVHDLISDFPIDWYLFHPGSNYIKHPSAGKSAHLARIKIENMISRNDVCTVIECYRSLAKMGIGRNLTIVVAASA